MPSGDCSASVSRRFWRGYPRRVEHPFAEPPPPGATTTVAPGIQWLRMPLPFALDHVNLWLIEDGSGHALVDTGFGDHATRKLWDAHASTTLRERPITSIVVTHFHPDHLGNAAWLAKRHGASIAMTEAEYATSRAVHAQTAGHALADVAAFFRAHGVDEAHVREIEQRGNRYRAAVPELPTHYRRLAPNATLTLGADAWRLIAGHGHSPEHAALHCAARSVLISGDMLLPRISTNVSVHAHAPTADSLGRFLDSLTAFAALPDDTLVLPSHGLPFRGIAERIAQLRSHHEARLGEILAATTSEGVSAAQIVPVLFRRELDVQQRFFAIGEAIAHLNHLVAKGRLARTVDATGRIRFVPAANGAA